MRQSNSLLVEMQEVFGASFGGEDVDEGIKDIAKRAAKKVKSFFGKKKKKDKDVEGLKKKAAAANRDNPKYPSHQKADDDIYKKAVGKMRGKVKEKSKKKSKVSDVGGSGGGSSEKEMGKRKTGGEKSLRRHFPFKRSASLGPGPEGHKHNETKCWSCKCGDIYSEGCTCRAVGSGKNCPPKGTLKKIKINRDYRRQYNQKYHAWRADKEGSKRLGSTQG